MATITSVRVNPPASRRLCEFCGDLADLYELVSMEGRFSEKEGKHWACLFYNYHNLPSQFHCPTLGAYARTAGQRNDGRQC